MLDRRPDEPAWTDLSPRGRELNIDLTDVGRVADVSMNLARIVCFAYLVVGIANFDDLQGFPGLLYAMAVAWLLCTLLTLWSWFLYLERARRPREDAPPASLPRDNAPLALTRIAVQGSGQSNRWSTLVFGTSQTTPESLKEVRGCSLVVFIAALIPISSTVLHAPALFGGEVLPTLAFWLSGTACALVAYLAKSRTR
ncbi:MAG TPA: hypothetical protein V6D47_11575 [Oscillatoriaceae cyanobacterium]